MFKAIKYFFIFLYHFFFIDQATGHQSNTKFFANAGYVIWCWLFPYAVMHGSSAPMELWLVFGAVVIGNRSLNVWMQNKSGQTGNGDGSWKDLIESPADGSGPPPATTQVTNVDVNVAPPAAAPAPVAPPTAKAPVVPNTADLVN